MMYPCKCGCGGETFAIPIEARLAQRPLSRASAVADRIMRRLKHLPVMYCHSTATIYRCGKLEVSTLQTRRLIAIYPGGTVEQAVAPISAQYDFTDPQADDAARTRNFFYSLESAARSRRAGRYNAAREHLENARKFRGVWA